MIEKKSNLKDIRLIALSFLSIICFNIFTPTILYAGGGGPTQPEVQGFTPIGLSEMVDPFTGDFSYNIPLMDIDGYPVNIAYSSGVSMDQEASWVGLGWNLNMGSIIRSMRGMPDDFDGDEVLTETSQKPQIDRSVNFNVPIELFGKKIKTEGASLDLNVGVKVGHSNYNGWSFGIDLGPSYSFSEEGASSWGAGLTMSGSSENGAGFRGNGSFSGKTHLKALKDKKLSASNAFGAGYNSRAGLQSLSYNRSLTEVTKTSKRNFGTSFGGGSASFDFGQQSYFPSSSPTMVTTTLSGSINIGTTLFASDPQLDAGFTYTKQELSSQEASKNSPAYGYFYLQNGKKNKDALLDFNRDNEGSITKNRPFLPSTYLTSDIFQVQAQGVGGSFKGIRNEVGYVFDPYSYSIATSGSFGFELGFGNLSDFGGSVSIYTTNSNNGIWDGPENLSKNQLPFEDAPPGLESFTLKPAAEMSVDNDVVFNSQFNHTSAEALDLTGIDLAPKLNDKLEGNTISVNNRAERIKRNELLSFLTIGELKDNLGLQDYSSLNIYSGAKDHHLGELTQLGTDGKRYVFGIPAYNHFQEEITMAIGKDGDGDNGYFPSDYYKGITLLNNDFDEVVSKNNKSGIDNFYKLEKTPAYAHSFLLTAVLSDDYVDSDNHKGPTVDDQGTYVKFNYTKVDNVKWRTPMERTSVFHNQGLHSDMSDDRGSLVYGEKELWYVQIVETKNYVAVFELADREDAKSAQGKVGGLNDSQSGGKLLKSITLYSRPDYEANQNNATPIQKVNFVYDYSLCPGYPGNIHGGGKLTLQEIYFTYQGSFKLKRSSYKFDYINNKPFHLKAVDRWGNYKPSGSGSNLDFNSTMSNADYPYTIQNENLAKEYATSWALSDIFLPSGGKIHVDYESDDYAYVQSTPASVMMPIVGVGDNLTDLESSLSEGQYGKGVIGEDDGLGKNRGIYVKIDNSSSANVGDYFLAGNTIYFKTYMDMSKNGASDVFEFVSGYAVVDLNNTEIVTLNDQKYLHIKFKGVKLTDDGNLEYNPISKAGILFGRSQMSRTFMDAISEDPGEDYTESGWNEFGDAVANAFLSFKELFVSPNKEIFNDGKCNKIVFNKSFVRLVEPSGIKYGGGSRVKSIKMYDNWSSMTNNTSESFVYGQDYSYRLPNGKSSGVASYEPQVGGDENSMKKALQYGETFVFGPDQDLFLDLPLMESQFPSPTVGYSRVTIKNYTPEGVTRPGTGKVVKEFYTAKDFPTKVSLTSLEPKFSKNHLPIGPKWQYLALSQGFLIENNNMHGKPKAEYIYPDKETNPNSEVRYVYKSKPTTIGGYSCFELDNNVQVLKPDGTYSTAELGVKSEAVADFTYNESVSDGTTLNLNLNAFIVAPIVLAVPTLWPSIDKNSTKLKMATFNKTVEKFGILEKTIAKQEGSVVETNNLTYDSETGEVLITQTTNNFNDKIYSTTYPAHWYYERMGAAYKNINYTVNDKVMAGDGFVNLSINENQFVEGDEVSVTSPMFTTAKKGWVVLVNNSGIQVVDREGNPISAFPCDIKVIRSGRRNRQSTPISNLTSLSNPINGIKTATFNKILNAGAIEFSELWNTNCNCFNTKDPDLIRSTNPYISNNKGVWRPIKSYTYLTDRSQTNVFENTNIRQDGVFTSFSPFYSPHSGNWQKYYANWTYVSEVSEFSPNGVTLETKDALKRYSASLLGFSGTLTTGVAANAKLNQVTEGSFEDAKYTNCMDNGFFKLPSLDVLSERQSHTGKNSIHVAGGRSVTFATTEPACERIQMCDVKVQAVAPNTYKVLNALNPNIWSYQVISGFLASPIQLNSNFEFQIINDINNSNNNGNQYLEVEFMIITELDCVLLFRAKSSPTDPSQVSIELIGQMN